MSVKRKTSRVQTGMKAVGIKAVDDLFKTASLPLIESIEMRSALESALVTWQEQCGLGPTGTVRQGIRLIHSRMATVPNASPPASPLVAQSAVSPNEEELVASFCIARNENNQPTVKVSGSVPEVLQKSFSSLEGLLRRCEAITQSMDGLVAKVSFHLSQFRQFI
jgi:hypothetical protein